MIRTEDTLDAKLHKRWSSGSTRTVHTKSTTQSIGYPTPSPPPSTPLYQHADHRHQCDETLSLQSPRKTTANMAYTVLTLFVLASLGWVIKHIRFCLSFPSAPGPASARWSKLWYIWKIWQGDFEQYDIRAHRGGGNIVPSSSVAISSDY
jgi:hypothetical protein